MARASRPTQTSRKVTSRVHTTDFPATLPNFPTDPRVYPGATRREVGARAKPLSAASACVGYVARLVGKAQGDWAGCLRRNKEHPRESSRGDAYDPCALGRASPAARCPVAPTGRICRWRSVRWLWRAHYLGASLVCRGLHTGCDSAVGPVSSHMLRDLAARMPSSAARTCLTQIGAVSRPNRAPAQEPERNEPQSE